MSASVTFEVIDSVWSADDVPYTRGEHTVEAPDDDLLRLLASAESAGAVVISDASDEHSAAMDSHVQSQEDGEAALAEAKGAWDSEHQRWTGDWHEANLAQFELDVDSGARSRSLGGDQ